MQDQRNPRRSRKLTGIRKRHARSCSSRAGGNCNCSPAWEASAWSPRERKRVWKRFPTEAAAKAWRRDAGQALERGTMRTPTKRTLREEAEAWLEGVENGSIRTRSGNTYKPSALRGYRHALTERVLPDVGAVRLSELQRQDVQALVDRLVADGLQPSTIRNAVMPLRAIYRRAVSRDVVAVNPTERLELPRVEGKRERIAAPTEGAALIAALRAEDRALWATAMYAGLRLGELKALRWADVDLAVGTIRVERSWDAQEGVIEPKSVAGRRSVPVAAVLRDYLIEHRQRVGEAVELVFGHAEGRPFSETGARRRAALDWREAELDGIGFHECRHTYASLMIAAGVNAKALSTFMGHANISITLDRYGHLMPGSAAEAADRLDAYLEAQLARTAEAESEPSVAQSVVQEVGSSEIPLEQASAASSGGG
ncbi:MAG: tyrosine-type recombinase/integrase [Solirubrobacterales bacterium]